LSGLEGFILSDIVGFPVVEIFVVPVGNALRWHAQRLLGTNARVSRTKFLNDLAPDIEA